MGRILKKRRITNLGGTSNLSIDRKLRSIDKEAFMNEICHSEIFQMDTDDPDELAAIFDNTLRSLLDRHAPVKHKNTTIRPCGSMDERRNYIG